jgi:hypothetical protein
MPALTMRGRYLMREYWSDSDLFLRLTAEQREVYQGLWMLSDDEGWMPRDVPAIAAALYRYEDREPREQRVKSALGRLGDLGKVLSQRCCLFIPAVVRYPRPGKKAHEHADEHSRHSKPKSIQTHSNGSEHSNRPHSNPSPVPTRPNPTSPAPAPEGAAPREGETESDFRQRTGLPAFMVPEPVA